jgi:hypothetical protein
MATAKKPAFRVLVKVMNGITDAIKKTPPITYIAGTTPAVDITTRKVSMTPSGNHTIFSKF